MRRTKFLFRRDRVKRRVIIIFIILLLSVSITACLSSKDILNPSDNSKGTEDKKQAGKSNNFSVTDVYRDVLQNKTAFLSTEDRKDMNLNDFLNKNSDGSALKVTHFAVLDMDGDKTPEVILELSIDGYPTSFEIMHYMNGKVYGYSIPYRGLESLKEDGSFWSSGGASDNACVKLKFNSNAYVTDTLGYSESGQVNKVSYFINNKTTTKEAFDLFTKEQNQKKDAVWYEFSQNNIQTELQGS